MGGAGWNIHGGRSAGRKTKRNALAERGGAFSQVQDQVEYIALEAVNEFGAIERRKLEVHAAKYAFRRCGIERFDEVRRKAEFSKIGGMKGFDEAASGIKMSNILNLKAPGDCGLAQFH